jgi:hypothetical protein
MRTRSATLALLMLGVLLAGCTGDGSSGPPAEAADLKSGYRFRYEVTQEADVHAEESLNGTVQDTTDVDESEGPKPGADHEVLVTSFEEDGVRYDLALGRPADGSGRSQLVAIRQSDLAVLGANAYGGDVSVYDFGPPGPLRFPLRVGDEWTYRDGFIGDHASEDGAIEVKARVTGYREVDGPDGPVQAMRVVHTFSLDQDRFQASLRNLAAEEDAESVDGSARLDAERVVDYAPALHAIVEDAFEFDVEYDLTVTKDGAERRYVFEGSGTRTQRLLSATLVEMPELGLDDLEAAIELGRRPVDPGVLPPGVSIEATLSPERPYLDNGTAAAFTVQVRASGLSEPLKVELRNPYRGLAGTRTLPASGGEAEFDVDMAGPYELSVTSSGSDPSASRLLTVPVGDRYWLEPSCFVVGTGATSCEALPFLVGANMAEVRFTVMHEGLATEPGTGYLFLVDGAGDQDSEMLLGHSATLRKAVDTGMMGNRGQWSVSYEPVGLPGDILYLVEVESAEKVLEDPWMARLPFLR